ncbi:unnamed protein product [Oppiella nova]|uniref:Uncharacterized protein n=1 Tax=Oppiella nova TaxID=334625 RepID=A0A7R9MAB5_9ACAR|nr:unnamed protein product [Oppiella nova]CAG2172591.1 unnamed protein product [Oppiella nova]
MLSYISIE